MATLDQIISRAYRETQITDIDEAPTSSQQAEALTLLQGIIFRNYPQSPQVSLALGTRPERATGQTLRDFTSYAPYEPVPQNTIMHCALTSAKTLIMPYAASDGARVSFVDVGKNFATYSLTLEGNGATIAGAPSAVLATNGLRAEYFFRRDLGDWQVLAALTQFQNMPFPEEFDDMFVIELSLRLNPRYGNEIAPLTAELFNEIRTRFRARYTQEASSAAPDVLFDNTSISSVRRGDGGFVL